MNRVERRGNCGALYSLVTLKTYFEALSTAPLFLLGDFLRLWKFPFCAQVCPFPSTWHTGSWFRSRRGGGTTLASPAASVAAPLIGMSEPLCSRPPHIEGPWDPGVCATRLHMAPYIRPVSSYVAPVIQWRADVAPWEGAVKSQ